MSAANINRVVLTGNLTRDPELKSIGGESGTEVCEMRIAVNTRRKQGDAWVDKPNYFDVSVWGGLGKLCDDWLSKGRGVAVDGRLEWREWQPQEGPKRQAVQIVADTVQFLGPRDSGNGKRETEDAAPEPDLPADSSGFGALVPVAAGVGEDSGDDEIPF